MGLLQQTTAVGLLQQTAAVGLKQQTTAVGLQQQTILRWPVGLLQQTTAVGLLQQTFNLILQWSAGDNCHCSNKINCYTVHIGSEILGSKSAVAI